MSMEEKLRLLYNLEANLVDYGKFFSNACSESFNFDMGVVPQAEGFGSESTSKILHDAKHVIPLKKPQRQQQEEEQHKYILPSQGKNPIPMPHQQQQEVVQNHLHALTLNSAPPTTATTPQSNDTHGNITNVVVVVDPSLGGSQIVGVDDGRGCRIIVGSSRASLRVFVKLIKARKRRVLRRGHNFGGSRPAVAPIAVASNAVNQEQRQQLDQKRNSSSVAIANAVHSSSVAIANAVHSSSVVTMTTSPTFRQVPLQAKPSLPPPPVMDNHGRCLGWSLSK